MWTPTVPGPIQKVARPDSGTYRDDCNIGRASVYLSYASATNQVLPNRSGKLGLQLVLSFRNAGRP